jgi:potassium-transporting ATPase KdpC subunit
MLRQLRPALVAVALFTALCGLAYPLLVTGIAQTVVPDKANGSEVSLDGRVVGSTLVAQPFEGDEWFQPRPSAVDYDASGSGAANLGPSNPELLDQIEAWADEYRARNQLAPGTPVPVDAVTMSGSGLDPHISPRNARLQAPRVAATRGLDPAAVLALVDEHTERRTLGFLGEPRVNVVALNMSLERLAR